LQNPQKTLKGEIPVGKFIALFILLLAVVLLAFPVVYRLSAEDINITVDSKERIVKGDSSYYLVFTENEVLKVDDSWIFFTWNASDRYNILKENSNYRVKAAGWRIPILSKYRNVVKIYK
jgi:hypothetical protein